jgi:hypothetical protein
VKKLVVAITAVLAAVSTASAVPTLTLTPLGTLQTGRVARRGPANRRNQCLRPSGRCVYIVNPEAGVLDVTDISAPGNPVKSPSVDIVAACNLALGSADCRLNLQAAGSRTIRFSVDLPANHLGPSWRRRA